MSTWISYDNQDADNDCPLFLFIRPRDIHPPNPLFVSILYTKHSLVTALKQPEVDLNGLQHGQCIDLESELIRTDRQVKTEKGNN